jgi:hypothetical protein
MIIVYVSPSSEFFVIETAYLTVYLRYARQKILALNAVSAVLFFLDLQLTSGCNQIKTPN